MVKSFIKFLVILLIPIMFAGVWILAAFGFFGNFGFIVILLYILAVLLGFVFWNKSLKVKSGDTNKVIDNSEVLQ